MSEAFYMLIGGSVGAVVGALLAAGWVDHLHRSGQR